MYEVIGTDEKATHDNAVQALKQRFKPLDIELRGLEFHQLMQEYQTVEQIGIQLQCLGRKALNANSKEFDHMLRLFFNEKKKRQA